MTVDVMGRRPAAATGLDGRVHSVRQHRPAQWVPAPCPPGSAREGYRLGRWERLALSFVTVLGLIVGLAALLSPEQVPTREVTVAPGDTVLSLVLRELPEVDPVRAAELVRAANDLDMDARAADLVPGTLIRVPALQ